MLQPPRASPGTHLLLQHPQPLEHGASAGCGSRCLGQATPQGGSEEQAEGQHRPRHAAAGRRLPARHGRPQAWPPHCSLGQPPPR